MPLRQIVQLVAPAARIASVSSAGTAAWARSYSSTSCRWLRTSTSDDYLTSGISYSFHPHRDTWYSAPFSQLRNISWVQGSKVTSTN